MKKKAKRLELLRETIYGAVHPTYCTWDGDMTAGTCADSCCATRCATCDGLICSAVPQCGWPPEAKD